MSQEYAGFKYRLAVQTPETATGKVAEVYGIFPPQIGAPPPLVLLSASPGLMDAQMGFIAHFRGHKHLGFELLAAIRFLVSRHLQAPACLEFNRKLLLAAGMTEAELASLPAEGGGFSEAERALLAFAVRIVAEPEAVTDAALDALRTAGWTDADIADAALQAANMQVPATLMRALTTR